MARKHGKRPYRTHVLRKAPEPPIGDEDLIFIEAVFIDGMPYGYVLHTDPGCPGQNG